MPREFKRADRVADAIQRSLATTIQVELRDPRLGMVNINAVKVSNDLAVAKVYVTFVNQTEADIQKRVEVLNNAASYMRSQVAKDLTTRTIPKLVFVYDDAVVTGQKLSDLIDRAVSSDKAHHRDEE